MSWAEQQSFRARRRILDAAKPKPPALPDPEPAVALDPAQVLQVLRALVAAAAKPAVEVTIEPIEAPEVEAAEALPAAGPAPTSWLLESRDKYGNQRFVRMTKDLTADPAWTIETSDIFGNPRHIRLEAEVAKPGEAQGWVLSGRDLDGTERFVRMTPGD